MNLANIIRTVKITSLLVLGVAPVSTNAMMLRYLSSLAGDACFLTSAGALEATQNMTLEKQKQMLEAGAKPSQISQLKKDAAIIAPYAPLLLPVGVLLSVCSRISMIKRSPGSGLLLTALSVPLNTLLICSSINARTLQAPDTNVIDKASDTGWNWYNQLVGRKNK